MKDRQMELVPYSLNCSSSNMDRVQNNANPKEKKDMPLHSKWLPCVILLHATTITQYKGLLKLSNPAGGFD